MSGEARAGLASRAYHEATKHSVVSVRRGRHRLDPSRRPTEFKTYPEAERVPLPRRLPAIEVPALEALRRRGGARAVPGPLELSRLLVLGAGWGGRRAHGYGGTVHFRTYASAGALYPVDVYLACGELGWLGEGVYHFDPRGAVLERIARADPRPHLAGAAGWEPALAEAPVSLVLTGIPWRTAWKYTERGYRHLFWDAGMILSNVLALAAAQDLPARVVLGFADREVEELLGLDGAVEFPLCLVAIGSNAPVAPADEAPARPTIAPAGLDEWGPRAFPEIGRVNDAGRLRGGAEARGWRDRGRGAGPADARLEHRAAEGSGREREIGDALDEVVLRRGSARAFSRRAIPAPVLSAVLSAAADPAAIPTDYAPEGTSLTEIFLVANAVEGLQSGSYRFRSGSFEPLATGDFRAQAAHLCLDQELGGDAAATMFLMSPLDAALRAMGDRGYRAAQLEAGAVAGRIYLGAYAYGYGASGLTFYDDEVRRFFGSPAAGRECMLVTAVGESLGRPDLRPVR